MSNIEPPLLVTFYGWISDGTTADALLDIPIVAESNGTICGTTYPEVLDGRLGYVLTFAASDPNLSPTCSELGQEVVLKMEEQIVGQAMREDSNPVNVDLVVE